MATQKMVKTGDLTLNVKDYGAIGDGTTDDTTAVTAAINAALAAKSVTGISGGTTNNSPSVFFPAGKYKITAAMVFSLAVTATANADRRRLTLIGDGGGGTVISYTGTADFMLTLKAGMVTIRNMRIIGDGTNNILRLGEDSATTTPFVNQFEVSNVDFQNVGIGVRLAWAFDGKFDNCGFFGVATGGVGVDLPYVSTNNDNINNVTFLRCHWEKSVGGTFVKARGGAAASTSHHMLAFIGCHMESRSYNTRFVDAEYAWRLSFTGGQFTQNNDPNGSAAGITFANAVSPFRFVNVTSVTFSGAHITRGLTGAYARKLFSLGGNSGGITLTSALLETKTGGATDSKDAIWESDATTAYAGATSTPLDLRECHLNSVGEAPVGNEIVSWQSPTAKANSWNARFNAANNALVFAYNTSTAGWGAARTDMVSLYKDGMLGLGSFLGGKQYTVVNNTTQSFAFTADANANRRGVYLVIVDAPGDGYALVFSNGSALFSMSAGAMMAVGSTDPASAGKMNVYLSGVNLAVNNLYGSDRKVSVIPLGGFF